MICVNFSEFLCNKYTLFLNLLNKIKNESSFINKKAHFSLQDCDFNKNKRSFPLWIFPNCTMTTAAFNLIPNLVILPPYLTLSDNIIGLFAIR